jgi:hypothetical protein
LEARFVQGLETDFPG